MHLLPKLLREGWYEVQQVLRKTIGSLMYPAAHVHIRHWIVSKTETYREVRNNASV
jgi:hypothetical protein